jgi:uncharacterized protein YndB with AHSA1/START domain
MMTQPNGRVTTTSTGRDLEITRTFRAPIEDVWASVTESERTARWFGAWHGEAGVGKTIRYAMGFEEGAPEGDMRIDACDAPRHLAVTSLDESGSGQYQLELHLSESNGVTELRLVHHLQESMKVSDYGPGWEFYLDNLVASRDGTTMPVFTDYYPSEYYTALAGG